MQISSLLDWLGRIFNPPPLASLSTRQKLGRVALISVTIVTLCIILAMILSAAIFIVQWVPELFRNVFTTDFSIAAKMAGIVVLSIVVNSICVFILLQVRRLDRELMNGERSLSRLWGKSGP